MTDFNCETCKSFVKLSLNDYEGICVERGVSNVEPTSTCSFYRAQSRSDLIQNKNANIKNEAKYSIYEMWWRDK